MFGFLRNATVIGIIAYLSPVHEQRPELGLASVRATTGITLERAIAATPSLALDAAKSLDPAMRDALARKIAQMVLSNGGEQKSHVAH